MIVEVVNYKLIIIRLFDFLNEVQNLVQRKMTVPYICILGFEVNKQVITSVDF